jgi:predicted nucleic acid-binding protein
VKQEQALDVLAGKVAPVDQLVVSTQVLLEFYAVATRKLTRPLDHATAQRALERLLGFRLVAPSPRAVVDATELSDVHGISIWDALIVRAARVAACDRILTEDLSDGSVIAGIRIENPFANAR